MPINIDGQQVTDITIDGQQVTEVTADGTVVWQADDGGGGPTVFEDFERTDPLNDYTGATGTFNVVSAAAYNGSSGLSGGGGTIASDGLADVPQRGDTFEIYTMFNDGSSWPEFRFAYPQTGDFYFIYKSESDTIELHEYQNESSVLSDTAAFANSTGVWYRYEVDFDSGGTGDITVDVYEDASDTLEATVSINSTTYDSGRIGFTSWSDTYWDYGRHI